MQATQEPVTGEENDDEDADADEDGVEPAGTLVGCYQDSDVDPILTFEYEDEDNLTPAVRASGEKKKVM